MPDDQGSGIGMASHSDGGGGSLGVLRALTEGIGGAQGGVVAGIAVIPLEIVVFRQGADPTGKSTIAGVARDIYQQSGALRLTTLRHCLRVAVEGTVDD